MADDNDAGAAYLASLRRSPTSAGAAPARAPVPAATTTTSAEQRRSPRYKCTGNARLQEAGSSAATWATFADISMHGCYIETAVPPCTGTTLNLRLEANGVRVDATGEVRVVYPGLGMGISFINVSDENRARLQQLVRSISPRSVILPSLPRASQAATPAPSAPIPRPEVSPPAPNPSAVLQAIQKFFENRHVMGREEFLKILRKGQ
jgi:PilZ domain